MMEGGLEAQQLEVAAASTEPSASGSSPHMLSTSNSNIRQEPDEVDRYRVVSLSVPPVSSRANLHEDEGASHAPISGTIQAENAARAAGEEGLESVEHLRVSLNIIPVATGGSDTNDSSRNEPTNSQRSPRAEPTSPVARHHSVPTSPPTPRRRRHNVQTTLTSSLVPPPPPQLPNLAREALRRLAANEATRDKDDSIDDFRPLKKRKVCQEVENDTEEEDEGQTCSICFEPWSNTGGHRIASLKCGHLFGWNCIEKWVKGQGGEGKCPQCNAKARKTDIRTIFAKSIKVVDTSERDRAIQEKEEEKALRIAAQKAEAHAVLQCQLARAECDRLKEQLKLVQQQLEEFTNRGVQSADYASSSTTSIRQSSVGGVLLGQNDNGSRYVPFKTISVSPDGGARVLAHDPSLGVLVASKPSAHQILPGCGLMKYSTLDLGHGEYVAAHTGVIRDAVFSPGGDGLVLTASKDKSCRLTSLHSNSNVLTYKTPSPVWACAWNVDNPNYVYAGLNGCVSVFDVRNTAESVSSLQREGDRAPVTSLSYVPLSSLSSSFNSSGLLAGSMNGGVFWEKETHQENFTPHPLSNIPGNCTCLSFEPISRHCLASFRPSKRAPVTPHSTHVLCQLCDVPRDQPLSCRPIHQFVGGTSHRLLSRSRLFQRPGHDSCSILAAFGVEEHNSVSVWNASTMSRLQTLSLHQGPALDIAPFSCGERDYLAVLSETTLSLFHWQPTSS